VAVARAGDGGGDGLLRASMNGRVIALLVAEGDAVAAGQPLVTLEAMKMEHVHCAPRAGRVALHVAVGAQVAARHVVAEIRRHRRHRRSDRDGQRMTRFQTSFRKSPT
jgi:geranyl-CoA carboxylase alpha subunit